jgi:flagellar biosynthesis/type III secretory pathway chaperone
MDFDGIVTYLIVEQQALEELSFKLEEERLILLAGRHRFLDRATAEVEFAAAALTSIGQTRATLLREAATSLGLPLEATLRQIADAAPSSPARERLQAMRQAMRTTMDAIRETTAQNRQLLVRGLAATIDALALLGTSTSYDASGTAHQGADRPALLDARA